MFKGNGPEGALTNGKGGAVGEKMEGRILKERMTKGTRRLRREDRMATKDNLSQRMEISKRTNAVFGRR